MVALAPLVLIVAGLAGLILYERVLKPSVGAPTVRSTAK